MPPAGELFTLFSEVKKLGEREKEW